MLYISFNYRELHRLKEAVFAPHMVNAGFILLSMTGWAVAKRLIREIRQQFLIGRLATLAGTCAAALLTSGATIIIFVERFFEGAWTYFLFIPVLYLMFSFFRSKLGEPAQLEENLGRVLGGQYLLPYQRTARPEDETRFDEILVPLDGSSAAEHALPIAENLCRSFGGAGSRSSKNSWSAWTALQSPSRSCDTHEHWPSASTVRFCSCPFPSRNRKSRRFRSISSRWRPPSGTEGSRLRQW